MKIVCCGMVLLLFVQAAWAQGSAEKKAPVTVEDYVGVWEAFREGAMPDKARGEEPSKLVVFKDSADRVIVLLAHRIIVSPGRAADRQINFAYGVAALVRGELVFTDQNGFRNRVVLGDHVDYGRYASVVPDFPGAESDLGRACPIPAILCRAMS